MDLTTHIRDILPHVVTLPQRFREAGYLSVSYGKIFHQKLDDAPSWSTQRDFPDNHTYRGLRGRAWIQAGGWDGWRYNQYMLAANREALARPRSGGIYSNVPPYERGPSDNPHGHGTTDARIAAFAIAALRQLRAQRLPWLLAVGFVRPHLPFNCPSSFFDAATAVPRVPSERAPIGASALTRAHLSHGDGELWDFKGARARSGRGAGGSRAGAADPRALRHAYAACVSFADAQAGRVLSALGTGALARRTIVVLMADHGWKLGHHGGWGKHTLMSADTRVPLLLHVPWLASSHGTRVDTPVELIDLYPTLLQLAALSPSPTSPRLQGRSLLPLMRGGGGGDGDGGGDVGGGGGVGGGGVGGGGVGGGGVGGGDVAFSQWWDHRTEPCMGYAVRVDGWTLIQWLLEPRRRTIAASTTSAASTRASARASARAVAFSSAQRGLAGRTNRSAFGAVAISPSGAQRRDAARCGGCAELYAMPSNGSEDASSHFAPERHNVIEQHLSVAFRLRAMLRIVMHVPAWAMPTGVSRGACFPSSDAPRSRSSKRNFGSMSSSSRSGRGRGRSSSLPDATAGGSRLHSSWSRASKGGVSSSRKRARLSKPP